jgi:uncharacterized protein
MEPTPLVIGIGLLAAVVLGISKTSMPAVAPLGVALLATVLPPLPSTGVALPVLLVGDAFAIGMYARHADREVLMRLLPSVVVGLACGWALVRFVDADTVGRIIGAILLLSVGGDLVRRARASRTASPTVAASAGGPAALLLGAGAGLSTMIANAGGPMMTLYLLRMRVTILSFLGTVAWFFLAVNLLKLPFSIGLGLITPQSLLLSALITPGVIVGALLGRRLVQSMSAGVFEAVALTATAAAGLWLAAS